LGNECRKLLEMGNPIMVGPTVLSTFFTMREWDLREIASVIIVSDVEKGNRRGNISNEFKCLFPA
jgi:hypothetical protein